MVAGTEARRLVTTVGGHNRQRSRARPDREMFAARYCDAGSPRDFATDNIWDQEEYCRTLRGIYSSETGRICRIFSKVQTVDRKGFEMSRTIAAISSCLKPISCLRSAQSRKSRCPFRNNIWHPNIIGQGDCLPEKEISKLRYRSRKPKRYFRPCQDDTRSLA
jgi:hypothetical protein